MLDPRLAALALLLTACGSALAVATPTPHCRPAPSLALPSAAAAPVSATADKAQVDPGSTVTFTETAAGPATVQVDCSQPLQIVVTDGTGLSVYSGSSAAAPASACGEVDIAGGAAESYQVTWPVDSSLPGGTYTATLVLGDTPELTLTLAVGTLPGEC
jgi:plastocyanin